MISAGVGSIEAREWKVAIAQLHQLAHTHDTAGDYTKALDAKLQAALLAGMFRFLKEERSTIKKYLDVSDVRMLIKSIGCGHAACAASMLDNMFKLDANTLPILHDLAAGFDLALNGMAESIIARDTRAKGR